MRNILPSLFVLIFFLCFGNPAAWAKPKTSDAVSGFWYTEKDEGGIELYRCADKICGRFYWLSGNKPGEGSPDKLNPDPALRTRDLCHLQFMSNFTPEGQGRYIGGSIYSPRHGQTFNAEMTLIDHNTLDVHGYVLTPLLGQSQIWKRAAKLPSCTSGS